MSLGFDDKLLGEKVDNYCSSSEDEDVEGDGNFSGLDEREPIKTTKGPTFIPESQAKEQVRDYPGYSSNTGPKGVINDWREFKRLETEKREEQEQQRKELMKKLSMTCRSHLDDEKEKEKDSQFKQEFEDKMEEFEEEFLKEYRQKRLEEMRNALRAVPKFGSVLELTSESFLEAIDKENPQVTVIIHLYEDRHPTCKTINDCLNHLATDYPTVKFCRLKASSTHLSAKFAKSGVPALLVYKAGLLIGNFVRISDELGENFFSSDVESFLLEHSFLPHDDVINNIIKDKKTGEQRSVIAAEDSDDSDD